MSHKLTMPEEIEFYLKELEEFEKTAGKIATRESSTKAQEGWRASYIPPCRAAYLIGKDNTK